MKILAVVAHADDETLGCGGTLARHSLQGDEVFILIVADGVASRAAGSVQESARRQAAARAAASALGSREPIFLDLPDQKLDQTSLLLITQKIEAVADDIRPDVVFTHYIHDLNADHEIVSRAVMTAFRPTPQQSVKAIYAFETLSSTEWNFGGPVFAPNHFVAIEETLDAKMSALRCYDMEMRAPPHIRSYESVHAQATLRGHQVGLAAAEAFVVLRQTI